MKKQLTLLFLLCPLMLISYQTLAQSTQNIEGRVVDENGEPVANAIVLVSGTFNETETSIDGTFKIMANVDDVLTISGLFRVPMQVLIEDTSFLNIQLKTDIQLLDEVLLTQKKKETELKNTAFGKQKKNSVGHSTHTLNSTQFSLADTDMNMVLLKMPGVIQLEGVLYFTKNLSINKTPVQIVLDGTPVEQNILESLNPVDIESVTFLKSLNSTLKYGQAGVGGVALIKTKLEASTGVTETKKAPKLLVQGNDYQEQTIDLETYFKQIRPKYLTQLEAAKNFEQAQEIYQRLLQTKASKDLIFYIDCSDYFMKWDDTFSYNVLAKVFTIAQNNPKVLRTIAYHLEKNKRLKQAKFVYETLVELKPNNTQSYRDLALIYGQTGEYEIAKALYVQMINNSIPNVDFTEITSTIVTEFRHFIIQNKRNINVEDLPNDLLVVHFIPKVRLLIEWTDPLSEFEVQFVGPQKKYFNWVHSAFENKEFVQKEVKHGYSFKEFEIEDDVNGEWLINVKNLKPAKTSTGSYLRYTLFKNYGLPSEEKKVVLIPLDKIENKVTLDSFLN